MRAEMGAAARDYRTEDDYLAGIAEFLREVLDDPSDYLEHWNLEEEVKVGVFVKAVEGLLAYVKSTLATSRVARSQVGPPSKLEASDRRCCFSRSHQLN